jgi:hypothetical protein
MVATVGSGIDTSVMVRFTPIGCTGCVRLCVVAFEQAYSCDEDSETRLDFISRSLQYIEAFFPACQGGTLINKKVCLGS